MNTIATTLARMRGLFTALVLPALLLLGMSSCITNQATGEREPNWPVISTELQLIEGDLHDLANIVAADEPETADNLRQLAGHVHTVKRGVDAYIAGGGPQGQEVFAAIDAALELADQLLDPDDETRIYVAAARMLARRIQAYLPQEPPAT